MTLPHVPLPAQERGLNAWHEASGEAASSSVPWGSDERRPLLRLQAPPHRAVGLMDECEVQAGGLW